MTISLSLSLYLSLSLSIYIYIYIGQAEGARGVMEDARQGGRARKRGVLCIRARQHIAYKDSGR